jgi:c-di-GMP-binding flagellar brake protein YcgR
MSPSSVLKDGVAPLENPRPDQRLYPRYPIRLDLQYKLLNHSPGNQNGFGRTVNISTGGIFLKTRNPLPEHDKIDLVINWPFLLDGAWPLKLIVHGRVVRSNAKGTTVSMTRYEFRTSKRLAT